MLHRERLLAGIFALLLFVFLGVASAPFAREKRAQADGPSSMEGLTVIRNAAGQITHYKPPFDKITALCSVAYGATTHISVKSGNWSDASVWSSGTVPGANARVHIAPGTTVTYDVKSDIPLKCVEIQDTGHLTFATQKDTRLVLDEIYVLPGVGVGGQLTIGTEANPIPANIKADVIFADTPLQTGTVENPGPDPQQFGKGLLAFGGVTMRGAVMSPTFVKVAGELAAGQTTIPLWKPVTGWQPGHTVVIPSTDRWQRGWFETVTIKEVSPDGKTITLTAPIKYAHPCARDDDGKITLAINLPAGHPGRDRTLCADAGNITRSVEFNSANPEDPLKRYHAMFAHRATVDVNNVRFNNGGRTQPVPLNNTTFDATGKVTNVGTNHIGRYTFHMHHAWGLENPTGTAPQFRIAGNSMTNTSKWGMTIHDAHYGLIADNVVYNSVGAGIAIEDNRESGNEFNHNFVVVVDPLDKVVCPRFNPQQCTPDDGEFGFGFWSRGIINTFKNNVVAGARSSSYWFLIAGDADHQESKLVRIPNYPGANPDDPAKSTQVDLQWKGPIEFAYNEVYGPNQDLKIIPGAQPSPPESLYFAGFANRGFAAGRKPDSEALVIDSQIGWHFGNPYGTTFLKSYQFVNNYVIGNNWLIRGDYRDVGPVERQGAAELHTVIRANGGANHEINNIDSDGTKTFLAIRSRDAGNSTIIRGGQIASTSANVFSVNATQWTQNNRQKWELIMEGVRQPRNPRFPDQKMFSLQRGENAYWIGQSFIIKDFNKTGESFQLYYEAQAQDHLTSDAGLGDPIPECVDKLTQLQCWQKYSAANHGHVACKNPTTRPDMFGTLLCPLTSPEIKNITATVTDPDSTDVTGPIGHWAFDESTGTVAKDLSGGADGVVAGSAHKWVTDRPPTSFANSHALDLNNATMTIPKGYYQTKGYTESFWVKVPTTNGIFKLEDLLSDKRNVLAFANIAGKLRTTLASPMLSQTSQAVIADNKWHHVAWVDEGGHPARLYIDGKLDTQDNFRARPHFIGQPYDNQLLKEHLQPWTLFGTKLEVRAQGMVDDLRVYSRALTPPEVSDLAQGKEGPTGVTLLPSEKISWTTSTLNTLSIVEYGLTDKYGQAAFPVTDQDAVLTGLQPNTTYHFKVCSEFYGFAPDARRTICSADQTFVSANVADAPARLTITAPVNNATLLPGDVIVKYVTSGDLASAGADHIHFQLDTNAEVRGISLTGGSHTFTYVAVGNRTVKGFIAKADHSKVAGTDVQVSFTVAEGGDSSAPTVSITAPAGGSTVAGTTNITANASDNVSVTKVEFLVDGSLKGTDMSSPFSFGWDTTNGGTHPCIGNHTHSLTAKAYDAAGNTRVSAAVSVNMGNPPSCNAAPTVNAGADQTITLPSTATLDGTVTDDGLPSPANLTVLWTKFSGPGTVTFGNAALVDTTASFSVAGTYVLRLTGNDSALSSYDDVQITVQSAPPTGESLCLQIESAFRKRTGRDQRFSKVRVRIYHQGNKALLLEKTYASDAAGTVTIPEADLASVPEPSLGTTYVIAGKIHGHTGVAERGVTQIRGRSECLKLRTMVHSDMTGDGKASIADLVNLVGCRAKGICNEAALDIFLEGKNITIGDIVTAIRDVLGGKEDEEE